MQKFTANAFPPERAILHLSTFDVTKPPPHSLSKSRQVQKSVAKIPNKVKRKTALSLLLLPLAQCLRTNFAVTTQSSSQKQRTSVPKAKSLGLLARCVSMCLPRRKRRREFVLSVHQFEFLSPRRKGTLWKPLRPINPSLACCLDGL